jgi:HEPN domain-containing protein
MGESAIEKLEESERQLTSGNVGNAINLIEIAVRIAIKKLESVKGIDADCTNLSHRMAKLTNDIELINATKVINDLFNPVLKPVELYSGTETPSVSIEQAWNALRYARKIINFIETQLTILGN